MLMEQVPGLGSTPKVPNGLSVSVREIYPGAASMSIIEQEAGAGPQTLKQLAVRRSRFGSELGMATAEYAIATLAAVGFAGLLVVILKSAEVRGFLLNIIRTALSM